jgi:hypothetical protein
LVKTPSTVATEAHKTSFTATASDHPLSDPDWFICALLSVAGAVADILFALDGTAPLAFHTSTVIEPVALPTVFTEVIVQAKLTPAFGVPTLPVPVVMGDPATGITIVWGAPVPRNCH